MKILLLVTLVPVLSYCQGLGSIFPIDFESIRKYKVRSDTVIKGHCANSKPCIMEIRGYDEKGNLALDVFNGDSVIYSYDAEGNLLSSITYRPDYDTTWRLKKYFKSDTLEEEIIYKLNDSSDIFSIIKYRYDEAKRITEFLNVYEDGIIIQQEKYLYPARDITIREKYNGRNQLIESYKIQSRKNLSISTCLKNAARPQYEGSVNIKRYKKEGRILMTFKNPKEGINRSSVYINKVNKQGQLLDQSYGSNVLHFIYSNGLLKEVIEGEEVFKVSYTFY